MKHTLSSAILCTLLLSCSPDDQNPVQLGFLAGLAKGYDASVLPGFDGWITDCDVIHERLPSPYTDPYQFGYYEGVWAKWEKDCFFERQPEGLEKSLEQFWLLEESDTPDFEVLVQSLINGQSLRDFGFDDGLAKGFDETVLGILSLSSCFFIFELGDGHLPFQFDFWYPYKAGYYEGAWKKWEKEELMKDC